MNLDMELLEHRRLLATRIWDGGGGDALWTTAANWVDDTAPVENDELVFPTGAAQLTNTNDFAGNTNFASITINASGYSLGGNEIDLDGSITTTYTAGTSTIDAFINLQSTQTFDVATGGELIADDSIFGGGVSI
ncbi:hypothetical protein [Tautonia plasticadhaerens]|uniref:hypothetical protein n=1 Tax=Tautonia plasticadhaerens TaxID=2527974 RepID=UPI0011A4F39C|nr:hypothetical protein [Tautonia plasticadhaerens]